MFSSGDNVNGLPYSCNDYYFHLTSEIKPTEIKLCGTLYKKLIRCAIKYTIAL